MKKGSFLFDMRAGKTNTEQILWEYEDELPKMTSEQFAQLFPLSKVIDGVRMYPFLLDETGRRHYLGLVISE